MCILIDEDDNRRCSPTTAAVPACCPTRRRVLHAPLSSSRTTAASWTISDDNEPSAATIPARLSRLCSSPVSTARSCRGSAPRAHAPPPAAASTSAARYCEDLGQRGIDLHQLLLHQRTRREGEFSSRPVKEIDRSNRPCLKLRVVRQFYKNAQTSNNKSLGIVFHERRAYNRHCEVFNLKLLDSRFTQVRVYAVKGYYVKNNMGKFLSTLAKCRIIINAKSLVIEMSEESFVPDFMFDFRNFVTLVDPDKVDETLLFDVNGKVTEIHNPQEKTFSRRRARLIEIILEDLSGRQMNCTLWCDYVDEILAFEGNLKGGPPVLILQLCRAKVYRDKVTLSNSFDVTQIHTLETLPAIEAFRSQIKEDDLEPSKSISRGSLSSTMAEYDDVMNRRLTCNLVDFIYTVDLGATFWVCAVIGNVIGNWCYLACTKCNKKLHPVGVEYLCNGCQKSFKTGVYKIVGHGTLTAHPSQNEKPTPESQMSCIAIDLTDNGLVDNTISYGNDIPIEIATRSTESESLANAVNVKEDVARKNISRRLSRKTSAYKSSDRVIDSVGIIDLPRLMDHDVNKGSGPPIFRMHGQNYHLIGSLLPENSASPKFAQMYIFDTENEVSNRKNSVRGASNNLSEEIIDGLKIMLDENNKLVKTFRMAKDRILENGDANVRVRLIGKRTNNRVDQVNGMPTCSEVAVLVVGDFASALGPRVILVELMSGILRRINEISVSYLALKYPLLLPYGEDGYTEDIPFTDRKHKVEKSRKNVSVREGLADAVPSGCCSCVHH
ncbi:hypothetical protein CASFOL_029450 [Castilleja foliolosa]|uniref:Uncharacterized protein n=1 Tax=Castilleja foliolosa TaxID=1961234 RepID=A0ABD3CAV7_9LAMI